MKSLSHGMKILAEVAGECGMTVEEVLQESREPEFVAVRRKAIVRLKRELFTLQAIGKIMQGDKPKPMHHTTVRYHLKMAGVK